MSKVNTVNTNMVLFRIKNLNHIVKEIKINKDDTIENIKKNVLEVFDYKSDSDIKIIFNGKVFKSEEKIFGSNIGMTPNDTAIVMEIKKKSAPKQQIISNDNNINNKISTNSETNNSAQSTSFPVNTKIVTPIDYWKSPPNEEDVKLSHSFEQMNAVMPLIINLAIKSSLNDINAQLLLHSGNTNGFIDHLMRIVASEQFENMSRQILQQSQPIVNSLRNGIKSTGVRIIISPTGQVNVNVSESQSHKSQLPLPLPSLAELNNTTQQNNITQQNNNINLLKTENIQENNNDEQITQEQLQFFLENQNCKNINIQKRLTDENINGHINENINENIDKDNDNINKIMEITGISKNMASDAYSVCDKNFELTISYVYEMLDELV